MVANAISLAPKTITWQDQEIVYGSDEHKSLLERCILESILQNDDRKEALLATKGLTIKHITGFPENPATFLTRLFNACDYPPDLSSMKDFRNLLPGSWNKSNYILDV